mmetsp:Transcript_60604/g.196355  ORF Transcript_60604/g.196355 Transcript_60604/m.196355 type:complete len:246 (+) Transcript_60604:315-1052(+)
MDVLEALRDWFELSFVPTIPSAGMQYAVTLAACGCEAHMLWPRKAKIFTVDPETDAKRFYANIETLCTTFRFPPVPGQAQKYHVEMRVPTFCLPLIKRKARANVTLVTDTALLSEDSIEVPEAPSVPRALCSNGCIRMSARGRTTCCRTCVLSDRARHGPTCEERTARGAALPRESTDDSELSLNSATFSELKGLRARMSSSASELTASPTRTDDTEDDFEELLPLTFAIHVPHEIPRGSVGMQP